MNFNDTYTYATNGAANLPIPSIDEIIHACEKVKILPPVDPDHCKGCKIDLDDVTRTPIYFNGENNIGRSPADFLLLGSPAC